MESTRTDFYNIKTIIGIDPGVTGGMAVWQEGQFKYSRPFSLVEHQKLNTRKRKPRKSKSRSKAKPPSKYRIEREYDLARFSNQMGILSDRTTVAFVEKVSSMPRDGVTQAFKFGKCYGEIRGVLAAFGIDMVLCSPSEWIRTLGLNGFSKDEREEVCREYLRRMKVLDWQDMSMTDGEVDAILIMMRGVRYVQNAMESEM